jgi:hypothetical protein
MRRANTGAQGGGNDEWRTKRLAHWLDRTKEMVAT